MTDESKTTQVGIIVVSHADYGSAGVIILTDMFGRHPHQPGPFPVGQP